MSGSFFCFFEKIDTLKISINDIEEIFLNELRRLSFSSIDLAEIMIKQDNEIQTKEELLNNIIAEQISFKEKIKGLVKEGNTCEKSLLQNRLKQIEQQIPDLQSDIDFLKIKYLRDTKDIKAQWKKLHGTEKRKIIEALTDQIIIGTGDVTITLIHN